MKGNGLRWTMVAQLARMGGIKGAKLLRPSGIYGYILSLREADGEIQQDKVNETHTGGYSCDSLTSDSTTLCPVPPGLQRFNDTNNYIGEDGQQEMDTISGTVGRITPETSPFNGSSPPELLKMDLTLPEENMRTMLCGSDDWGTPETPRFPPIHAQEERSL